MFWKLTSLSASSPVESVLDKENFTLEELLDEEEIIQECKAMNSRLVNFLRDRDQVKQLLRYIVEESPEDAENQRAFKFPFIACEIFTCEIDVILKTLVEEKELMDLLLSFLEPIRPHSPLLAGYFSKVVICLMMRKTIPLMTYIQAHQNVFPQLVDLIGITSIMEVLVRLVGADGHAYPCFIDMMQWLAASNLLEMIVDKLISSSPPEVHANAAETLCAISRNAPSALATKLSSPSFVARIFGHALEQSQSNSSLVCSLSVCISILDPKRSSSPFIYSMRSLHSYDSHNPVNSETVVAMLPKLSDLLMLLDLSSDNKSLPTTYGELKPPLGKHRLKIVEFMTVLIRSGNEVAEKELVSSGAIQRVLELFFEYPYNNSLHHHVESIILYCLESKSNETVEYLLQECNLVGKMVQTDKQCIISDNLKQSTLPTVGKRAPRTGNLGHITRISNKLIQVANSNSFIQAYLQANDEWINWKAIVLLERNVVENVYRWACGRPTALHDRTRDSDEEEMRDRDYDVTALANNISHAFRYNTYQSEDAVENHGAVERNDEESYLDDEAAEVVISSLRLGDDQSSSLFTNSNWFTFQDDRADAAQMRSSNSDLMEEINLNGNQNDDYSSSDDEVVVGGDDELTETKNNFTNEESDKATASGDMTFFQFEAPDNEDLFGDKKLPDWVAWGDTGNVQIGGCSVNPFNDHPNGSLSAMDSRLLVQPSNQSHESDAVHSLFEDDVEFVGVELEGTERALKEGIVGEAGTLKKNHSKKLFETEPSDEGGIGMEFNDANYWRVDQEITVVD